MTDSAPVRVRRARQNANYTAISNKLIDHPTLSHEARLVQMYLLSKPADWQLQISDLRRMLGTGGKVCGRNKTYEVVSELKAAAYIVPHEEKRQGRFSRITYYVFDEPHEDPGTFRAELSGEAANSSQNHPALPYPEFRETEQIPVNLPCPEKRETVSAPHPQKPYPENRDSTKDRNKQSTDLPPSPKVSADQGRQEFEILWKAWPHDSLPDFKEAARAYFCKLTTAERTLAVASVPDFLRNCQVQKTKPFLITFLKQKVFRAFADGPEINAEGRFVINPTRPEWSRWLDHIEATVSVSARANVLKQGFLYTLTRLPPMSNPETMQ